MDVFGAITFIIALKFVTLNYGSSSTQSAVLVTLIKEMAKAMEVCYFRHSEKKTMI